MGLFDDPFGISSMIQAGAAAAGRASDQKFMREQTNKANAFSVNERKISNRYNAQQASVANQRNVKNAIRTDAMNDENARVANRVAGRNEKRARDFNAEEAQKSRDFTAEQNRIANAKTVQAQVRAHNWAEEDYARGKQDQASQFTDLRAAAEAAGLNPLSVLGAGSVPTSSTGLSSSSFAAGSGAAATATASDTFGGQAPGVMGASVPMSYGAPVAIQPLVSGDAVVGAVGELGRELTGVNAINRANEQVYTDLAKIQLEQSLRPTVDTDMAPAALRPPVIPTGGPPDFELPAYMSEDGWQMMDRGVPTIGRWNEDMGRFEERTPIPNEAGQAFIDPTDGFERITPGVIFGSELDMPEGFVGNTMFGTAMGGAYLDAWTSPSIREFTGLSLNFGGGGDPADYVTDPVSGNTRLRMDGDYAVTPRQGGY
ncbi:MAG: hypothetical protein [Microviridae sp.]|nr:MAG: hypothetical protein [Microviridae sp.]